MRVYKKRLLNSMETLIEVSRQRPELVRNIGGDQHNTGGYSASVVGVRFGILRAPDGSTSVISPDAYYSLENKIRASIKKSIEEDPKTVEEAHNELKRALPTLPKNKHEKQLLPMYQAANPSLTHVALTELVERKEAICETVKREEGLVEVYQMKKSTLNA